MANFEAKIVHEIGDLSLEDWNQCANPTALPRNPFLRHEFLSALENSGSVSSETGWQPFHIALEADKEIVGVMPLYLKNHSQGEYVFDHSWADAFQRAGGNYYPKLQGSIPFTPATGRRILSREPSDEIETALINASIGICDKINVSSVHLTFLTEAQWQLCGKHGFLRRIDQQFHWKNAGYTDFRHFVSELSAKKRKNIRRERREALSGGISVEWLSGSDLTENHWDAFYNFYVNTGARKWGSPYLNRKFFSLVTESMAEDILLIMCKRNNNYIAGALNFIGSDTLFGRNWGCSEYHPFLHFETCYYQAIDFAIARGLSKVEAGAQGQHKVARGYLPQKTFSAHWINHQGFREAINQFLDQERDYVEQDIEYLENHSPFNSGINLDQFRDPDELRIK